MSPPAPLAALWQQLGITAETLAGRRLPVYAEARRLQPVGLGTDGRDKLLSPAAAAAWLALRTAAQADGQALLLVSAFRSIAFQAALIQQKLGKGQRIGDILAVNAPPGCSEHHTGRALDLGVADMPPLDERFETTPAFAWLHHNAARYGFRLSYPRANRQGFVYEPWHWCWQPQ